MWQLWVIVAGIFFVGEIFTAGFLIFWLGVSALITMLVSFITTDIIIQTSVFIILSVILIFATRPFVNKFIKTETVKTNAYSIIGKKAIVIQEINPVEGKGQIKVNGEVWSAESINGQNIPQKSEVEIVEIKGVKAIVTVTKLASTNKITSTNN